MKLKSIKLAGFKSFADPTTIPVRSNLCGIVGPNGCGKSNVIDAVRWVIGESSAKQLRGKSMADVIFNGSNKRQPMGRAMVELQFDNQEGRLGGEYAKYAELSIRREVVRDGQSIYSINNTTCRRRDVLDIFLGTGLGPRSYAIIEQGMVSRLIEAKPEDLRVFIEEAAGVSKYKERRRETANRIKHTRENLERVDDLVDELARQMRSLQKQAAAAERYQALSSELKLHSAQLKAMQWRQYAGKVDKFGTHSQSLLTNYEEMKAQVVHCDTELERLQDNHQQAQQSQQQAQQAYYATGAETARIEQQLQHQRQQTQQWQQDLTANQAQYDELSNQSVEVSQQLAEIEQELAELTQQQPELQAATEQARNALDATKQDVLQSQTAWDSLQTTLAQQQQQAQVSATTIKHSQTQLENLAQQLQHWQHEQQQTDTKDIQQQLTQQTVELSQQQEQYEYKQQQLTALQTQLQQQRADDQLLQAKLQEMHSTLQQQQGRLSALEALQQAALGKDTPQLQSWLQQHKLQDLPRLAEQITVQSGWELVVEAVLRDYLAALCCTSPEHYQLQLQQLDAPQDMAVRLFDLHAASAHTVQHTDLPLDNLASRLEQAPVALKNLLAHVYIAEDRQQALQYSSQLAPHEMIVTPTADCFAAHWVQLGQSTDPRQGQLQRQQQLTTLQAEIATTEEQLQQLQQQYEQSQQQQLDLEQQRSTLQQDANNLQQKIRKISADVAGSQARLDEITQHLQKAQQQLQTCELQQQQQQQQLTAAETSYAQAEEQVSTLQAQQQALRTQRDTAREAQQQAQTQVQYTTQELDALAIRINANQSQQNLLQQSSMRDQKQLQALEQVQQQLQQQLADAQNPDDGLAQELEKLLQLRLQHEQQLKQASTRYTAIEEQRTELLEQRKRAQQVAESQQLKLQEAHLEHKEVSIRQQTLVEQLQVDGHDSVEVILAELPEAATINSWQQAIEKNKHAITRLGAINLAAIEELKEVSERHQHLTEQHNDLDEALQLLESAIAKIDKETKHKFKQTFDAVNVQLQQLFPTVFNGGQAYLEMVDVTDPSAGILIRAQPPGKRNTSIHMLSGGEKALTAIALVFAMFQLNPAPFCILDEVDAPLDDVNVGRYCELIKKMAAKTQYLVISHSKITMSMMQQLLGVTMQEAGVSRLVAVDVQEAVAMAE